MTPEEAGHCLIAGVTGNHKDIFFPKIGNEIVPLSFVDLLPKLAEQIDVDFEFTSDEELVKVFEWPPIRFRTDPGTTFTSNTPNEISRGIFKTYRFGERR